MLSSAIVLLSSEAGFFLLDCCVCDSFYIIAAKHIVSCFTYVSIVGEKLVLSFYSCDCTKF